MGVKILHLVSFRFWQPVKLNGMKSACWITDWRVMPTWKRSLRACKAACWCIQDDENSMPSMGNVIQILEVFF